ncbi:MAG TPA: PAS domain S-box protein [Polyangia bacterium]
MVHRHLARQLRRLFLDRESPPSLAAWQEIVDWISNSFAAFDRERYLAEHSIELASGEMQELNAKLSVERDKLKNIFRSAPVAMGTLDPAGRIVDVNCALEELFGYSREELLGKSYLAFLSAEDNAASREAYVELVEGTRRNNQTQRRMVAKDGRSLLVNIGLTAVRDRDGKAQLLIATVEDITERTHLEIQLRHSQKLESVGRLAAGIAHEINTPIQFVGDNVNFLSGAFEQLLALCASYQGVCKRSPGGQVSAEDMARIKHEEEIADLEYLQANIPTSILSTIDGVGRVAKIVQSMKAFAHPDRSEKELADLNLALRNTLTVASNELKYVATVETQFGDLPMVPCFLSDLNQVFLNLLVNAAHAIGDVVGKSGQRGVIGVRTYCEQTQAVVAISDSGTGVPADLQSKIFEPFFTTKEVGKGTGQGLALARSVIVEEHGGTLTFTTELGKGTTFFIRIPIGLEPE